MANSTSHAALPYPIRKARFTLGIPYVDADGDPTDPGTPDTEFSLDASAMADCAEEVTTVSTGFGYITLTGAETDGSLLLIAGKVGSGPKNTLAVLYPKNLAVLFSGTAAAGAAGSMTFPVSQSACLDLTGCFIRTTGGTGGGGTGGANNQARRIISYNRATRVATVSPNWETTPSTDTTFDVLLPEGVAAEQLTKDAPIAAGAVVAFTSSTSIEITGNSLIQPGSVMRVYSGTGAVAEAFVRDHAAATSGSPNTTLDDPGFPEDLDTTSLYLVFSGPNAYPLPLDSTGAKVLTLMAGWRGSDESEYDLGGDGTTTPFFPE